MLRRHAAGERDRLVTIQAVTQGTGTSRFPTETPSDLFTAWASMTPLTGRERFTGAQISAPFDTQWQLPYREDVDPDLVNVAKSRRLVYRQRVYDIVAAMVVGRRDAIELVTLSGGLVQ